MVIVEADTLTAAQAAAALHGMNPGGEAAVLEVPSGAHRDQPRPYHNHLLQRDELTRIFGPAAHVNRRTRQGWIDSPWCANAATPAFRISIKPR